MSAKPRVFLRGITSDSYQLSEFRAAQLAADRVRDDSVVVATGVGAGYSSDHRDAADVRWRLAPGDEDFLTQTLQVHFVELPPHSENQGHGHQNEAAFFILEGAGYEIHDGLRYDWKAGDLAFVHVDSVHQHFNPYDEKAVVLVIKAKCTWMFLGLVQQGRSGPIARPAEFGERVDWSAIWTEGVLDRKKIITPEDGVWETTPLGRLRMMNSPAQTDHRQFSVDAFELVIPPGSRSGKHWKMADEVLYVLDGAGYSLHWEVREEIAEKYYARVAKEPTRYEITKGDTLYVPQNTVAQHFAADGTPLRLLSTQNRMFKLLGYDQVHYFENAPEYVDDDRKGGRSLRR
jgi:quercetin dioxygenase-like cupin family protein